MKKNHISIKTFFFLFSIVILSSNCREKSEFYRFIDHLEEANVTTSPLKNIEQKFEAIEQNWTGNQMFPFELQNNRFLCVPTQAKILSYDDTEKPIGMKLLKNGKEIEFSKLPSDEKNSWMWKRISEVIEPVHYKGYKSDAGAIILSKNEYFVSNEFFIPEGEILIEITARSGRQMKYLPNLTLYLNDELVGQVPIRKYKKYAFLQKKNAGMYKIKAGFSNVFKLDSYSEKEKLYLDTFEIKSSQDLILISHTERDSPLTKNDNFKAVYSTLPTKKTLFPGFFFNSKADNFTNDLSLKIGESVETDIELIAKENMFEIMCHAQPKGALLILWLDGKNVGRKWITPWERKSYLFQVAATEGKHRLKVECKKPQNAKKFLERQVIIHHINMMPSIQNDLAELYKYKDDFEIHDHNIGKNPYSIKKKMELKNISINAFLAPPKSRFDFKVKIPESGHLEFGYGLLENSRRGQDTKRRGVKFSILLEENDETENIFIKSVNPRNQKNAYTVQHEKIDLSPYYGKQINICFITENIGQKSQDEKGNDEKINDYAVWFNPVIYPTRQKDPPRDSKDFNVILISIDTLRADHLGCYGYQRDTSPAVDALAKESVLFSDSFAPTSSTLPSHMSMLTSLYPIHNEFYSQRLGIIQALDPSILTLADILRTHDYFTGAFAGGAFVSAKFGFSKGFDFYLEDEGSTIRKDSAARLFRLTSKWLRNNKDKKFFLFLHTYQVHAPYYCPEPYNLKFLDESAKYKEAHMREILGYFKYRKLPESERQNLISLYDSEIRYTDECFIKPLIDELKRLNIFDSTMLIFTSDHGEELYEHKGWLHEHALYNELIRIPLIIKFPNAKHKGKKISGTVSILDIIPTILEELGIGFSKKRFDGKSVMKLIDESERGDRATYAFRFVYLINPDLTFDTKLIKISTISNAFKLILNHEYPADLSPAGFKIPGGPPFSVDEVELFNLEKDPMELNSIAEINKMKVREMLKELEPYYLKAKEIERAKKQMEENLEHELRKRLEALGYIR